MLTKWGVIYIEATGLDPSSDENIEIGFLLFEQQSLVKKFSSLVKNEHRNIPPFVSSLTGICTQMLQDAPRLQDLHDDLSILQDSVLIAHNASFEESFLRRLPFKLAFVDSLPFLGMCNLGQSTLGLESLILKYNLANREDHRGYQDALDLLKVLILSWDQVIKDDAANVYRECFAKYLPQYFFTEFINLFDAQALRNISSQIEFTYPPKKDTAYQPINLDLTKENIDKITSNEMARDLLGRLAASLKNDVHSLIELDSNVDRYKNYLMIAESLAQERPMLIASKNFNHEFLAMASKIPEIKIAKATPRNSYLCQQTFAELSAQFLDDGHLDNALAYCYLAIVLSLNKRSGGVYVGNCDIPAVLFRNNKSLNTLVARLAPKKDCGDCKECDFRRPATAAHLYIGSHEYLFDHVQCPSYIIVDDAEWFEESVSRYNSAKISFSDLANFYFDDISEGRRFNLLLSDLKKEIDALFEPGPYWQERPLVSGNITELLKQLNDIVASDKIRALLGTSDSAVRIIKWHADYEFSLEAVPVDIGKIAYQKVLSGAKSVNFVGCNYIGNSKLSAEWATGYAYLDTHRYRDPFRFVKSNNLKIYLANDLPALNDPDASIKYLDALLPIIASKKVVLLFSAHGRFEVACQYLKAKDLPLFIQGNARKMLEEFDMATVGVLVANDVCKEMSNVDLLFMDKIPDRKVSIVTERRKEFFDKMFTDAFTHYNLAYRARMLQHRIEKIVPKSVIVFDQRTKKWQGKSLNNFIELIKPYSLDVKTAKEILSIFTDT
jgi:DNA polymerase III epsilon subunit-like protein